MKIDINISKLNKYIKKETGRVMNNYSNKVIEIMRQEVPVDTGLLKASVHSEKKGDEYYIGHNPDLLTKTKGDDYAKYVFYGTIYIRPNNWIGKTIARLPKL